MFKNRPCGCKGKRSCKLCEEEFGAWKIQPDINKEESYYYCPYCDLLWPGWDAFAFSSHPHHKGEPKRISGISLMLDYITKDEEKELLKSFSQVKWDTSQSGRLKQNYGPKCNFRKRKVDPSNFSGFPAFSSFIHERFLDTPLLESFRPVEQCSLDYDVDRGSCIDLHIDDCWIWGERVPTLSLLAPTVLTFTKYEGPQTKYNLEDVKSYTRAVQLGQAKDMEQILNDQQSLLKLDDYEFKRYLSLTNQDRNPELDKVTRQILTYDFETRETPVNVIRVAMPPRSLIVLFADARYAYEHAVLREDVTERRVALTFREITPTFMTTQLQSVGLEIMKRAKEFFK